MSQSTGTATQPRSVRPCAGLRAAKRAAFALTALAPVATLPPAAVDLPAHVESYRTMNRRTYFKSGDIGQALVVHKDERAAETFRQRVAKTGTHPSGITPPMRNIARTYKRQPYNKKEQVGRASGIRPHALRVLRPLTTPRRRTTHCSPTSWSALRPCCGAPSPNMRVRPGSAPQRPLCPRANHILACARARRARAAPVLPVHHGELGGGQVDGGEGRPH